MARGFTITITLFALEMLNCICMFVSLFTSFNIIGLTSYEMYACVAFFFLVFVCWYVCMSVFYKVSLSLSSNVCPSARGFVLTVIVQVSGILLQVVPSSRLIR